MASRDFNPRTGRVRLFFRDNGRQYNKTIRVQSDREAIWAHPGGRDHPMIWSGAGSQSPRCRTGHLDPLRREGDRQASARFRFVSRRTEARDVGDLRRLRPDADAGVKGDRLHRDRGHPRAALCAGPRHRQPVRLIPNRPNGYPLRAAAQ